MLPNTSPTLDKRLSQADYEALADFRYALRQFLRISEEFAYTAGLTPQQHQGLLAIKGFPGPGPITVGELAERLQLRPHSAVMLVDRLVVNQLVERRMPTQPQDQRQVHLALTEQGEAVIEQLTEAHREELYRLQPNLARICADLRGESAV